MNTSIRESVELFHLLFMEQLSQKIDKKLYALKGGCNLRFFLGSIRYSEDIDIDVHTVSVTTLEKNVTKILESTPFKQVLATRNITIDNISALKQTQTTQRWKVALQVDQQTLPINTKIEFSRRKMLDDIEFNGIDKQLTTLHRIRPLLLSHYSTQTALQQKLAALIHRSQTQARDVFDIDYLLHQGAKINQLKLTKKEITQAINAITSISFSIFNAQVVAYLPLEIQSQYDTQAAWDDLRANLIKQLEELN